MRLGPPPAEPEAPGQFWKDFVRDTAPVFRGTTTEQLAGFIVPTWQALLDGARYVDERLAEIFAELDADVIVEDNVCAFPAIAASGRPWVRIVSCNPLEVPDPSLPPAFSGLALDDRDGAEAFRSEYARQVGELQAQFSDFCVRARRAAAARAADDPRVAVAEPDDLPRRARLPPLAAARSHLAQPADQRPRDRCALGAARARRPPARVPQPRLARLGRRRADARRWSRRWPRRRTGTSSAAAPATPSTSWPTTCWAPSSCRRRRCCRTSTR